MMSKDILMLEELYSLVLEAEEHQIANARNVLKKAKRPDIEKDMEYLLSLTAPYQQGAVNENRFAFRQAHLPALARFLVQPNVDPVKLRDTYNMYMATGRLLNQNYINQAKEFISSDTLAKTFSSEVHKWYGKAQDEKNREKAKTEEVDILPVDENMVYDDERIRIFCAEGKPHKPDEQDEEHDVDGYITGPDMSPVKARENCVYYGQGQKYDMTGLCISYVSPESNYYNTYRRQHEQTQYFVYFKYKNPKSLKGFMLISVWADGKIEYNTVDSNDDIEASPEKICLKYPDLQAPFNQGVFVSLYASDLEQRYYKVIEDTDSILELTDVNDMLVYAAVGKNISVYDFRELKSRNVDIFKEVLKSYIISMTNDIPKDLLENERSLSELYKEKLVIRARRSIDFNNPVVKNFIMNSNGGERPANMTQNDYNASYNHTRDFLAWDFTPDVGEEVVSQIMHNEDKDYQNKMFMIISNMKSPKPRTAIFCYLANKDARNAKGYYDETIYNKIEKDKYDNDEDARQLSFAREFLEKTHLSVVEIYKNYVSGNLREMPKYVLDDFFGQSGKVYSWQDNNAPYSVIKDKKADDSICDTVRKCIQININEGVRLENLFKLDKRFYKALYDKHMEPHMFMGIIHTIQNTGVYDPFYEELLKIFFERLKSFNDNLARSTYASNTIIAFNFRSKNDINYPRVEFMELDVNPFLELVDRREQRRDVLAAFMGMMVCPYCKRDHPNPQLKTDVHFNDSLFQKIQDLICTNKDWFKIFAGIYPNYYVNKLKENMPDFYNRLFSNKYKAALYFITTRSDQDFTHSLAFRKAIENPYYGLTFYTMREKQFILMAANGDDRASRGTPNGERHKNYDYGQYNENELETQKLVYNNMENRGIAPLGRDIERFLESGEYHYNDPLVILGFMLSYFCFRNVFSANICMRHILNKRRKDNNEKELEVSSFVVVDEICKLISEVMKTRSIGGKYKDLFEAFKQWNDKMQEIKKEAKRILDKEADQVKKAGYRTAYSKDYPYPERTNEEQKIIDGSHRLEKFVKFGVTNLTGDDEKDQTTERINETLIGSSYRPKYPNMLYWFNLVLVDLRDKYAPKSYDISTIENKWKYADEKYNEAEHFHDEEESPREEPEEKVKQEWVSFKKHFKSIVL